MTKMAAAIPRSLSIGCTTLLISSKPLKELWLATFTTPIPINNTAAAIKPAPCTMTRMRRTSV